MENTEIVTLTNLCVISNGSRILLKERTDCSGVFFPGGHVEKGEPIVDSVIREIQEETGLIITDPVLCGIKDWIEEDGSRYIVFLFKAEHFTGELRSSKEGRVFWAERTELSKLPVLWHMDSVLKVIEDRYSELFLDAEQDWKPILKM